MGVANFFDKTVVIRRLKTVSANKVNFCATATADGSIKRIVGNPKEKQGIITKNDFVGFFDLTTDIEAGDLLYDKHTGDIYRVLLLEKYEIGINQHQMVRLEKTNV